MQTLPSILAERIFVFDLAMQTQQEKNDNKKLAPHTAVLLCAQLAVVGAERCCETD